LEWLYYDNKVWWIQLREITTIDELDFYSNRMSSEHLPGLIKPLIWSINIPLVCGAWITLLEEIIGNTNLLPMDMAKQFYFRAYYNMSALGKLFEKIGIPRDSLEIMMRGDKDASIRPKPPLWLYPKLLRFAITKTFFERKLQRHLKESEKTIKRFKEKKASNAKEALSIIDELFKYNKEAAYFVIVSQLLHNIFHRFFMRLSKDNVSELSLEPTMPSINPTYSLRELSSHIFLTEDKNLTIDKILSDRTLSEEYLNFIDHFGHLSDSGNDFSEPTWLEVPEQVLSLIKFQIENKSETVSPRKHGKSLLYKKVIRLYELREKISFNYTKSYGLFRNFYLIIAKELVKMKILEEESDIFYLEDSTIRQILSGESVERKKSIQELKQEMKNLRDIVPPSEIYGNNPPPVLYRKTEVTEFKGIPASNGYYKGIVKHVKSLSEFNQVEIGEILVIPFSDISWLPILSKAGAIISESGGILSHAAVVAREYNIPAILGVKSAFKIPEGADVFIDGYKGVIKLME
jgi:pyruvate,water dikinase